MNFDAVEVNKSIEETLQIVSPRYCTTVELVQTGKLQSAVKLKLLLLIHMHVLPLGRDPDKRFGKAEVDQVELLPLFADGLLFLEFGEIELFVIFELFVHCLKPFYL